MAQAIIKGKVKWFKFLGEPRENKFKSVRETDPDTGEYFERIVKDWSMQLAVGSAEKLLFRQNKVKKQIKFDEDLGDFVNIDYLEIGKKGVPNKPVKVVDAEGNPWPEDKWIGNLSTVEATINIEPYKFQKQGATIEGARLVPTKIVIVDHVPYQSTTSKATNKAKRVDTVDWSASDDE